VLARQKFAVDKRAYYKARQMYGMEFCSKIHSRDAVQGYAKPLKGKSIHHQWMMGDRVTLEQKGDVPGGAA